MFHHAALRLLFAQGVPDPAGHGQIVADSGLGRTLARARRPQAAVLVAQLTDPAARASAHGGLTPRAHS